MFRLLHFTSLAECIFTFQTIVGKLLWATVMGFIEITTKSTHCDGMQDYTYLHTLGIITIRYSKKNVMFL